ncbi:MAG: hypothetical protein LBC53_06555 [Spirochaetaceae bacterium]|jgi:hypothetical protein|nr:hypothetical protein [Spirochaetaceae bacterium]
MELLFDACAVLKNKGIRGFSVSVIGGVYIDIPPEHKDVIKALDSLPYRQMYDEIENSDFILALIDRASLRYINAASGSYQLSLGFERPIVLNERFACAVGFTRENSVIYEQNSDLADAMAFAAEMSAVEYARMASALKDFGRAVHDESFNNLKRIFTPPPPAERSS